MRLVRSTCLLAVLAIPALLPTAARADTHETCAGFIDSVPATITTQGVWCLRKNLATNISNGSAITIATNNVTIDCNDFKIGGLAAGDGSFATGIYTYARRNATVRHCNVRGFYYGIALIGAGSGHLVEDNRLDNNLLTGIWVLGENNLVQRNHVSNTGGHPGTSVAYGIQAHADIIDNTVAGNFAVGGPNTDAYGISSLANGAEVRGNRVRRLVTSGTGSATGIHVYGQGSKVAGNWVTAETMTGGTGIHASGASSACMENVVVNFSADYASCDAGLDNIGLP